MFNFTRVFKVSKVVDLSRKIRNIMFCMFMLQYHDIAIKNQFLMAIRIVVIYINVLALICNFRNNLEMNYFH